MSLKWLVFCVMNKEENNFEKNNSWWKPAMFFYAKATSWIILPLLLVLVLYKQIQSGSQFIFIVLIILSFCVSCFGIWKEIKKYQQEINKENGNK